MVEVVARRESLVQRFISDPSAGSTSTGFSNELKSYESIGMLGFATHWREEPSSFWQPIDSRYASYEIKEVAAPDLLLNDFLLPASNSCQRNSIGLCTTASYHEKKKERNGNQPLK